VKKSAPGRWAAGRLTLRRVDRPGLPHYFEEMSSDKHRADATPDSGAHQVQGITTAADRRDEQADARDMVSSKRDMAANLDDWIRRTDDDGAHEARELAWGDRIHARRDRIASAHDRDRLAFNDARPSADIENG
jgi:hypothetical protein